MYCEYCGTKLGDDETFCRGCGVKLGENVDPMTGHPLYRPQEKADAEAEKRSSWLTVLSVFLPLVGLVLWLLLKKKHSGLAISAAKGALIALSLLLPLAGFIIFITKKDKTWEVAKVCGISAIVGLAIATVFVPYFFTFALMFGAMG